jgi:hypothetical protein
VQAVALIFFRRNQIALKYKDILAEKAKERQLKGQELGRKTRYSGFSSNDEKLEKKTRDCYVDAQLGKIAGTSESSIAYPHLMVSYIFFILIS